MSDEGYVAEVYSTLEELIPRYLERRRADIVQIRDAVESGDLAIAESAGHSMKGSGGGYGFDPVTELGAAIEKAAAEGRAADVLAATDKLEHYLENVRIVIIDEDD